MGFFSIFRSKPKKQEWTNCCKAPREMKIDPPLPDEYTAWIHRAGWMLYVHEPTQQGSWIHPVKLARLEAQGLKGPGKVGPEMYIVERNVNIQDRQYVIDYSRPPWGGIRESDGPTPGEFPSIDEFGWVAWEAKRKAKFKEPPKPDNGRPGPSLEQLREFLRVKQEVMRPQRIALGLESEDGEKCETEETET